MVSPAGRCRPRSSRHALAAPGAGGRQAASQEVLRWLVRSPVTLAVWPSSAPGSSACAGRPSFSRTGSTSSPPTRRRGAEERLRRDVEALWPLLERVGLVAGASTSRLSFSADLAQALTGAEFVQENVPDDDELKTAAVTAIDGLADPEVVIASSTSGILPSVFQARCRHPERVLVGHPFNPAHLIPLVEVVAGEMTSAAAVDWVDRVLQPPRQAPPARAQGGARVREQPHAGGRLARDVPSRQRRHRDHRRARRRRSPTARVCAGPSTVRRSFTSCRADAAAWPTRWRSSTRRASPTGRTTSTPRSATELVRLLDEQTREQAGDGHSKSGNGCATSSSCACSRSSGRCSAHE